MLSLRKFVLALSLVLVSPLTVPAQDPVRVLSSEARKLIAIEGQRPSNVRRRQAEVTSYLYTRPVTVGIDAGEDPDELEPLIRRAIGIWDRALDGSPFVFTSRSDNVDIRVRLVDTIAPFDDIQGEIQMERSFRWGGRVEYKLNGRMKVKRTAFGETLSDDELVEVIAHELGHELGLDDRHEARGLMGPLVVGRPRLKPSAEEIEAVKLFRASLQRQLAMLSKR